MRTFDHAAADAKFDESKHPRANNGQFGAGSGKSHAEHAKHHWNKADEHAKAAMEVGNDTPAGQAHRFAGRKHLEAQAQHHSGATVKLPPGHKWGGATEAHAASLSAYQASRAAHATPKPAHGDYATYEQNVRGHLSARMEQSSADPHEIVDRRAGEVRKMHEHGLNPMQAAKFLHTSKGGQKFGGKPSGPVWTQTSSGRHVAKTAEGKFEIWTDPDEGVLMKIPSGHVESYGSVEEAKAAVETSSKTGDAGFEESKHPRDAGKFASKPGAGAAHREIAKYHAHQQEAHLDEHDRMKAAGNSAAAKLHHQAALAHHEATARHNRAHALGHEEDAAAAHASTEKAEKATAATHAASAGQEAKEVTDRKAAIEAKSKDHQLYAEKHEKDAKAHSNAADDHQTIANHRGETPGVGPHSAAAGQHTHAAQMHRKAAKARRLAIDHPDSYENHVKARNATDKAVGASAIANGASSDAHAKGGQHDKPSKLSPQEHEEQVYQHLVDKHGMTRGDAQGLVEGQEAQGKFEMASAHAIGMSPKDSAEHVLKLATPAKASAKHDLKGMREEGDRFRAKHNDHESHEKMHALADHLQRGDDKAAKRTFSNMDTALRETALHFVDPAHRHKLTA